MSCCGTPGVSANMLPFNEFEASWPSPGGVSSASPQVDAVPFARHRGPGDDDAHLVGPERRVGHVGGQAGATRRDDLHGFGRERGQAVDERAFDRRGRRRLRRARAPVERHDRLMLVWGAELDRGLGQIDAAGDVRARAPARVDVDGGRRVQLVQSSPYRVPSTTSGLDPISRFNGSATDRWSFVNTTSIVRSPVASSYSAPVTWIE